jgi:glycosyltransferase involved in cell wall biosynthesis
MKSKDISKHQSALLNEALGYGKLIEEVILVHFFTSYTVNKIAENVTVVTFPIIDPTTPFRLIVSTIISFFISLVLLMKIVLKYKVNLIRADDIIITGMPVLLVSYMCRIKSILNVLGNVEEVVIYKLNHKKMITAVVMKIIKLIEIIEFRNYSACVLVSKNLEPIARKYKARKIFFCYPNVDLSLFQTLPNSKSKDKYSQFSVLYVGRLEPEKGVTRIVNIAEKLRTVDFIIVGYGSQEQELRNQIKIKNLSNIQLLGMIDHNLLPQIYKKAHVLLLPSYTEGVPVVMLEAMMSELPVIVTDVGSVKEILNDDKGGFVVPIASTEEIIKKIQILMEHENLRMELGKLGRINVISKFSNYINTQMEIFKFVMNKDTK